MSVSHAPSCNYLPQSVELSIMALETWILSSFLGTNMYKDISNVKGEVSTSRQKMKAGLV